MADQAAAADVTMIRAEAKSLADIGDFERAREALSRGIDIAPNDPELHAYMAWYTYRCRSIEMNERERLARHHLAVSFEQGRNNPHAHFCQGQILVYQGNGIRAKVSFEAALNAKPDYAPAITALERLGTRSTATVTLTAMPAQMDVRPDKPKARKSIVVLTIGVALMGALGFLVNTADDRDNSSFAKQLGTKYALRSISKNEDNLQIDVGASWAKIGGPDRTSELKALAGGAKALNFRNVFIFSDGTQVAEIRDGKVCTDPRCLNMLPAGMIGLAGPPPPEPPKAAPAAARPPAPAPPAAATPAPRPPAAAAARPAAPAQAAGAGTPTPAPSRPAAPHK
jgi:tetratricopeptide (TPR) repeat protein